MFSWMWLTIAGAAFAQGDETLDECSKDLCIHRKTFFDGFRTFHGEGLGEPAVASLRQILNEWDTTDDYTDTRWLAYILATAYHESAREMVPVREGLKDSDEAVVAYLELRRRQGYIRTVYWDPDPVTAQHYYGRGLVQLTHRRNYVRMGVLLGGDLIVTLGDVPDTALDPAIAVAVLMRGMVEGWFNESDGDDHQQGLGYYIQGDEIGDGYIDARRTVNKITPFDPIEYRLAGYAEAIHEFLVTVPPSELASDELLHEDGATLESAAAVARRVDEERAPAATEVEPEWGPTTEPAEPVDEPVVVKPVDPCGSIGAKIDLTSVSKCKAKRLRRRQRREMKQCRKEQRKLSSQ